MPYVEDVREVAIHVSIRLSSDLSCGDLLRGAHVAASRGLDGIWLANTPLTRSAPIAAAAISAAVPDLDIGIGVLSVRERHPVVLAQEMIAVQSFCTGRLTVGLGLGSDDHRRRLGLPATSGLALLRETAGIVRELSRHGRLGAVNGYAGEDIALRVEPIPLKAFLGAIGPRAAALAGEVADGVIISLGSTAVAAQQTVNEALKARAAAGSNADFRSVAYVAFGGLRDGVTPGLRNFTSHLLEAIGRTPAMDLLMTGTGVTAATARQLVDAGDPSDELVTDISISGSLAHCVDRLRQYAEAGVDEVALGIGRWNEDIDSTLLDAVRLIAAWNTMDEG